jgi:2-C-methyl-D-erythritol 4-phosphate cytidylyltransferase
MGFDKLWADLCGRPLLAWPLETLGRCAAVNQLVVVTTRDQREALGELISGLGIDAEVVLGGERRRDSVLAGLHAVGGDWVAVHDAARPLVTGSLVTAGFDAAAATGAAIAAVRVTDTVKDVEGGTVVRTLERARLWAAQTPQVFRRELLFSAHERSDQDATDDAALVEALGTAVQVYEGAYANIKVTTPSDLQLAAALLSQRLRESIIAEG